MAKSFNLKRKINEILAGLERAFQETGLIGLHWIAIEPDGGYLCLYPEGDISEDTLPEILERVRQQCVRLGAVAVLHVTPMGDDHGEVAIVQAMVEMRAGLRGFEWQIDEDRRWIPESVWYELNEDERQQAPRLLPYGTNLEGSS